MNDILNRAHRIVNDDAIDSDYIRTNIHACLAHILIVSVAICSLFIINVILLRDIRKTINKFINKQLRELSRWNIVLTINTLT
jgi:hypothetical protein